MQQQAVSARGDEEGGSFLFHLGFVSIGGGAIRGASRATFAKVIQSGVRLGLLFPKVPNPGCVSGNFSKSDPIRGASRVAFSKSDPIRGASWANNHSPLPHIPGQGGWAPKVEGRIDKRGLWAKRPSAPNEGRPLPSPVDIIFPLTSFSTPLPPECEPLSDESL